MKQNSCKHIAGLHPEHWLSAPPPHVDVAPIDRPLLGWLPDEYLYSLIARNHAYWGHTTPAETIDLLFGKGGTRVTGREIDAIEMFVARTGGSLGGALEIVENHTLLRFYQVFMRVKERERYFAVRQDVTTQLKFPLALWNGKFTATHPLKACAECVTDDDARFGTPYWHLQHQYPGSAICLKHKTVLQQTTVATSSAQRFLFHTPTLNSLAPATSSIHRQNKRIFWELAVLIHNLAADMQAGVAAMAEFRARFIAFMADRGLLNPAGRLVVFDKPEVQTLCEDFLSVTRRLLLVDDYKGMPTFALHVHHTLSTYIGGNFSVYMMDQIALIFWFRTLPFWTADDEREWLT